MWSKTFSAARHRDIRATIDEPMSDPQTNPQVPQGASFPATSAAAFVPVTPVAPQPILSLVPPIASPTPGETVRHPDPIASPPIAPYQQPSSIDVPIAPVRRRMPITPLIAAAPGAPIQNALSVAPLIPGPQAHYPAAAGMPQPTSFPFHAAQPFSAPQPFAIPQPYAPAYPQQPPAYGFAPTVAPVQTFVAIVTLYPAPPQQAYSPYPQAQPQFASFQPMPGYAPPVQQQPSWPMPQPMPQQQWAPPASPQWPPTN
jgi:hypothetical protein